MCGSFKPTKKNNPRFELAPRQPPCWRWLHELISWKCAYRTPRIEYYVNNYIMENILVLPPCIKLCNQTPPNIKTTHPVFTASCCFQTPKRTATTPSRRARCQATDYDKSKSLCVPQYKVANIARYYLPQNGIQRTYEED